jgi:outer membrane receptor protein involved in Fe transport
MTRLVDRYQFAAKSRCSAVPVFCPGYASAGASRRSGACVASRRWLGGGWLGRGSAGHYGHRLSLQHQVRARYQRRDIRISDGISSEDIGKFPAENITEAIQRIAGVQMSNINGRGSTISIRGLGAQYARTTVSGQTFASADFLDGFRYDIIQTDMASGIRVIKSPTADMDTGGLSGTVNIETVHPLDYKGSRFTLTAGLQPPIAAASSRRSWAAPMSTALPMAPSG